MRASKLTGGGSPQKPIAGATAEATAGRLPAGSRNAARQAKGFDLPHTRTHPDSEVTLLRRGRAWGLVSFHF